MTVSYVSPPGVYAPGSVGGPLCNLVIFSTFPIHMEATSQLNGGASILFSPEGTIYWGEGGGGSSLSLCKLVRTTKYVTMPTARISSKFSSYISFRKFPRTCKKFLLASSLQSPNFLKLLRSLKIDSKELKPPAYVAWRASKTTLFLLSS
jgi:hypothetical protein